MKKVFKLGVLAIVTSSVFILGGCGEKKSVLFDKHYSQVNWDNNFYEVEKSLEDLDKDRYKITKVDNQSLEVLDKEADSNDKIVYTFLEDGDTLGEISFRSNSKDIGAKKVDDDIEYTVSKEDTPVLDTEAQKLYIDGEEIPKEKKVYFDSFMFDVYQNIDYKEPLYEIREMFDDIVYDSRDEEKTYKSDEVEEQESKKKYLKLYNSNKENITVEFLDDYVYKLTKVKYTDEYGRVVQSEINKNEEIVYKVAEKDNVNLKEVKSFKEQRDYLKTMPQNLK